MQILALVPSVHNTSPGQRFRIEQWEQILNKMGAEITYAPFESQELHESLHIRGNHGLKLKLFGESVSRRAKLMKTLERYDVIYIFREAALFGPPLFERWIHRSRVPFVFDFDDAIFESYKSPSNGYLSYLKLAAKTKTICRLASHVMVGNPYLAEYARQFNEHVTIVPTTIDTEQYNLVDGRSSDMPVIGWTGSFSTVQHLDTLRNALERLGTQKKFRLRVIGAPVYKLKGVEVEAMPWRASTELENLCPIDIGIMPLPDDAWSKGKCGLKALQFMALGIPTVCSPVGVNTEIIQDGINGFIAATEDEWVSKLSLLLDSADLRRRLGRAGRNTVETKYSAQVQAPRVYDLLTSVIRDARRERVTARELHSSQVQDQGS